MRCPKVCFPKESLMGFPFATKSQITALHSRSLSFGCTSMCVLIQPCNRGLRLCALKSVEQRDGWRWARVSYSIFRSWAIGRNGSLNLCPWHVKNARDIFFWVPGYLSQQDGHGGQTDLRPSIGELFESELGPGDQAVVSHMLCFFSMSTPQATCRWCTKAVKQVLAHAFSLTMPDFGVKSFFQDI